MSNPYIFCETMAAYLWHIRKLGDAGPKFSGGADTVTLCGVLPSWDIRCEITETSLSSGEFGAGKTCPECAEIYRSRNCGEVKPP
jgi:hypothetical protein